MVSYPASAGVALEIFELEQAKPGAGFEKFLELSEAEDPGLIAAAESAGLHDPLSPERVREIAAFLERELNAGAAGLAAA